MGKKYFAVVLSLIHEGWIDVLEMDYDQRQEWLKTNRETLRSRAKEAISEIGEILTDELIRSRVSFDLLYRGTFKTNN